MFHKRLFFISKELQLIQGITINGAIPCTSETSDTNSSLLLRKKKPTRKKKRKEKARSSVGRNPEKSHNTNTKFHFREVIITSEDYKNFIYISKNYIKQNRSPHLKKIIISKVVLHIGQHLVKAKTTRKRKRRKRRKRKRKKRRKRKGRRRRKRKWGIGRKEGRKE